jgi:quercetin dioxygenase-like cupin family protein
MKRTQFILSALTFAIAPMTVIAQDKRTKQRTDKGFKINAGEGRIHDHIKLKGVNKNILDLKVSGSDTDGGFALFEATTITPGMGTPLHIHHLQDEVFYVVEGHFYFQVGEDKFQLGPGDSIFLPMNVPHAWTQVSETGKMTVLFQPAGKMEDYFVTVSALDHEPTHEEMAKLFADHEMKLVGPPLKID